MAPSLSYRGPLGPTLESELERVRKWISRLVLRLPLRLHHLRAAPVLGHTIHFLSHHLIPANQRVWMQIEAGPAMGLWFELNPRVGRSYLRGEAEPAVQEVLAARLRPGMVFYDLGANTGLFSLLAAKLVGSKGRIFSFEPDAEIAARLRRNVERNGFSNVTVVESGVWSSSGTVNFVPADSSSPDRGTGRFESANDSIGVRTRCVALDDFIVEAPSPDAIKCDVEGGEVEALKGAERLLHSCRPWILCEMHSDANDRASRNFLGRCGYRFEAVDDTHVLALPLAMGRE